jgi:hypothetical protein
MNWMKLIIIFLVKRQGFSENFSAVLRIRIHRIHMFLGLPDPDPSVIKQNSKKNLDSYYFVTLFYFLSLKNDVNVPFFKSN